MSLLARLLRKGPDDEALTQNFFTASFYVDATNTYDYPVPLDAELVSVVVVMGTADNDGGTNVAIDHEVGAIGGVSTDIVTVTPGTGVTAASSSIASDTTFTALEAVEGDNYEIIITLGTLADDVIVHLGFVTI